MRRTETTYSPIGLRIARDYEKCFSSMCHHVSNDSFYGKPFLLEPFQRENIWKPIFATGEMKDGQFKRRFRRVLLGLPSGYGKTELAAGIVLTIATMEVVHNGQYGVVASSKDQVRNIFEKIVTMIKLNEDWREQWDTSKEVITHKETGAKIMVLPNKADALESWHFNVLIFDELHVYRDSKVWDAGIKGQKVLNNPLSIAITTAGDKREGFLWDMLGRADNDTGMYLYWLGLDDKADINSQDSWKELLVASWVTWDDIQDQRNTASSARSFERYTANRFPRDKDKYSFFTDRQLENCSKGLNKFDFTSPYTIGIDGATSGDSYAIVAYQEFDTEKGNKYGRTKSWIFDTPDEETGYYPLNQIMELLAGVYNENPAEVVGIDPNRMIVMSTQLSDMYGIETVAFAQNNATMCQASSLTAQMVKSGKLKIKGQGKLREHLANVIEEDRQPYGSRFGKDSRKSKIDGAIALAIAVLAYKKLVAGFEDAPDIY